MCLAIRSVRSLDVVRVVPAKDSQRRRCCLVRLFNALDRWTYRSGQRDLVGGAARSPMLQTIKRGLGVLEAFQLGVVRGVKITAAGKGSRRAYHPGSAITTRVGTT